MDNDFMVVRTAVWISVIILGSEIDFANGDSEARREAREIITASAFCGVCSAWARSEGEVKEPVRSVRFGWDGRVDEEEEERRRAVMVWFCERRRSMILRPVLEVAPRMRICIFAFLGMRGSVAKLVWRCSLGDVSGNSDTRSFGVVCLLLCCGER